MNWLAIILLYAAAQVWGGSFELAFHWTLLTIGLGLGGGLIAGLFGQAIGGDEDGEIKGFIYIGMFVFGIIPLFLALGHLADAFVWLLEKVPV